MTNNRIKTTASSGRLKKKRKYLVGRTHEDRLFCVRIEDTDSVPDNMLHMVVIQASNKLNAINLYKLQERLMGAMYDGA